MTAVMSSAKRKFSEMVSAVKNFRINKDKLIDLLLILFLWLVIFDPPFIIGFNILHIVGGASFVYLVFKRQYWMSFLKFEAVLVGFFLYVAVVSYLNGVSLYDIIRSYVVYWIIDIVPIAFVITDICRTRKYNYEKFEQLLIGAGIVFTVISLSAILSTTLHDFYFDYLTKAGVIRHPSFALRTYGFASNLLYSSSIACAVIGVMCMRRFTLYNKIYCLILSVAMMVVSYYNARISLFVYVAGCVAIFITYKKHRLKLFIIGASFLVAVIIGFACLRSYVLNANAPDKHIVWLYSGLANIFGKFFGETDKTKYHYDAFGYYLDPKRYTYPGNIINLLFGTGETILNDSSYNVHSDIGFVNDVWYGGFVYVIAAYIAFIAFCRKLKEKLPGITDDKLIGSFWSVTFVLAFIICNIKGIFITFNNITTLMWLLLVFAILRNRELSINDFPFFKKKKVS